MAVNENCIVPLPINLYCWKHHTGFIKQQIKLIKNNNDLDLLKVVLLKTGNSQMDLYWGKLSPTEISEQVILILHENNIITYKEYFNWLLKNENGYQLVALKDKSVWILRPGENFEKFVHIHPGRYSPHTIRVKATTLKTAIFILAFIKVSGIHVINTETINHIRQKYLNEPPIKSYINSPGLTRLIDHLKEV
jgi:hypothetical protein